MVEWGGKKKERRRIFIEREKCNFCGRSITNPKVNHLVKSPLSDDLYICDLCINICSELVNSCETKNNQTTKKRKINSFFVIFYILN